MADWRNTLLYEAAYWITHVGYQVGWSLRTEGRHLVPQTGPLLIVANHQSFLDPVAIGLACRRHIHYLARKTLFKGAFGNFLRAVNCVPVDQEGIATNSLKSVLRLFDQGEAVLVFPEGERTWDGKMLPLRPGVSLLIRRGRVPVLPVGVAGAFEAYPRTAKVPRLSPFCWPATGAGMAISVGRPLDTERLAELPREQALDELFVEIQKVQQRAERLRRKR